MIQVLIIAMSLFFNSCISLDHKQIEEKEEEARKISILMDTHIKPLVAKELDSSRRFNSVSVGIITSKGTYFYGFKDEEDKKTELPDEKTIYEIASITKVFTGILLADAVISNPQISLDAPIGNLLPEGHNLEYQGNIITLRHLAYHTSGLPRVPTNMVYSGLENPYINYTETKLKEFLKSHKLERRPGEKEEYSNLGYGLLGYLLTNKKYPTFEQLVFNKITKKLGLRDTVVKLTPEQQKRFRTGFLNRKQTPPWAFGILPGAGALKSTTSDLVLFLKANMLPSQTPLESQLLLGQGFDKSTDKFGFNERMALAWGTINISFGNVFAHSGMTAGSSSFVAFDPNNKVGVVVLSNNAFIEKNELDGRIKVTSRELFKNLLNLWKIK